MEVKVGVGVVIIKQNAMILVGKRKGSHGAGEWAVPGGHLEYGETIEQCAIREVLEETGMTICNVKFLRLYELFEYLPKHYIDIGVVAEWDSGDPQLLEPDKCEGWEWVPLNDLLVAEWDSGNAPLLEPGKGARLQGRLFATMPSLFNALHSKAMS